METIQIVLDTGLLRAADGAARRARVNRSELVRRALGEYLKWLDAQEREARDRRGYQRHPDLPSQFADWERAAKWPE